MEVRDSFQKNLLKGKHSYPLSKPIASSLLHVCFGLLFLLPTALSIRKNFLVASNMCLSSPTLAVYKSKAFSVKSTRCSPISSSQAMEWCFVPSFPQFTEFHFLLTICLWHFSCEEIRKINIPLIESWNVGA